MIKPCKYLRPYPGPRGFFLKFFFAKERVSRGEGGKEEKTLFLSLLAALWLARSFFFFVFQEKPLGPGY